MQDQIVNFGNTLTDKRKVNYISKDFNTIRTDLLNYLEKYFPEQWQDFNLASPGMAMVELNAYVGDLLSYSIDKRFNELFRDGVSERKAVYRMADTFGYKVPGVRASSTVADISIEVPTTDEGPDESYLPLYRAGVQIRGGGQTFEAVNDIDFSNDYSEDGVMNRKIIPILNANQDLLKYRITKREVFKAGITKIFKKELASGDGGAFYELILPETNVLEIVSVIVYSAVGIKKIPTYQEFNDFDYRFWEVDYLPTSKIFMDDDTQDSVNGVKAGKYITVNKRFEKHFLPDGRCKLVFGAGQTDYDTYDQYLNKLAPNSNCTSATDLSIADLLSNLSLGEIVEGPATIFVKYRIGGGVLSNVGSDTLQSVGNIHAEILGNSEELNQAVIASTVSNNPIPAIGGKGLPSVEEIKYYIAANFAAQERCVTLEDYISRCYQIPGKYGSPFRIFGKVEDNKVKLYILSQNGDGQLIDYSSYIVKNNLVSYLTPYRMINDFVEINDGKFVNLQVEADLHIDKNFNASEVKITAIQQIRDFFDIEKWQMNQHIYISQVVDILREIPGVINVVDIRFYNMEGGPYSETLSAQATSSRVSNANGSFRSYLSPIDNTIYSTPISMFEIRYPERDILIRVG